MDVYTAEEVAEKLKVDYKTVLRLIKRGILKCLPGIRHKRITEAELNRYLGIQDILAFAGKSSSRSSNGSGAEIVVKTTAKAVARSIAPLNAKK